MTPELEQIEALASECERGARLIRFYADKPDELRAWAARIESGIAPNAVCTPAEALERAAREARAFLADNQP